MNVAVWKWMLAASLALLIGFPVFAMMVSEMNEVVILRNLDEVGESEETRIWIAEGGRGYSWIRASEDKRWAQLTRRAGRVDIRRRGDWGEYRVREVPGKQAREEVNRATREKYGVADWMIMLLRDASETIPFRLTLTR